MTETARIRIYMVEDHAVFREGLRAILELDAGFVVAGEAADAEQALRDLQSLDVDVVLMDVRLPGMSGIEAVRLLKERRPGLPVVMLTASQDAHVLKALEAGAAGYMLKTTTLQQLAQAVRSAHDGKRPLDPEVTGMLVNSASEVQRGHQQHLISTRQLEVLQMVAGGISYQEIAARLFISVATVNREMRAVFDCLGVNDAAHAVAEAYKKGLLS